MASKICALLIVFVHNVYGQRQLFITPSLGMAFPLSYTIIPAHGDKGYRANTFDFGASLDLSLQYQINQHWIIFGGLRVSDDSGFGFLYGDTKRDLVKGRLTSSTNAFRFPFGIEKNVLTKKWGKIDKRTEILKNISGSKNEDVLYLILFRLRILTGLSYNYTPPATYDNALRSFSYGSYTKNILDRNSFSVFIGFRLQFFNYEKDHLQLTALYSRGITQVAKIDVDYQLPTGDYSAILGSRGSYFSLQLGYPIKLINLLKRRGH